MSVTTGSTAVVYCYPQNMGALTKLIFSGGIHGDYGWEEGGALLLWNQI
jgi:hypothetical protein